MATTDPLAIAVTAAEALASTATTALGALVAAQATIATQAALIAKLQANPPAPVPVPTPTPTPTPAPAGNVFTVPYPFPSSTMGQKLSPSAAVQAASAGKIAKLLATFPAEYGGVGVNFQVISRVPSTQPGVPFTVNSGANDFTSNTGKTIQLPSGVVIQGSGDHPEILWVQGTPPNDSCIEAWQVAKTAAGYSASWAGKLTNLSQSTGVFPAPFGDSASGLSYLATLITQNDILAGVIAHQLPFQVGIADSAIVGAADRTDEGSHPGYLAYGDVVRLPAGLAMPGGMAKFAQLVFVALQVYGAVVIDQTQASGQYVVAEDPSEWKRQGNTTVDPVTASMGGQPEYSVLSAIPWASLEVVTP